VRQDERAGKPQAGKTCQGNRIRTLRMGLTQLAHAAARTKGTYLSALYQLVGIFRPVVPIAMLPMFHTGQDLALRRLIAPQLG
jgi:hypothetical protein